MQFRIEDRKGDHKRIEIPENRRNNFNVIRLLAAILVMYGHMFPILGMSPFTVQRNSISTYGVMLLFSMGGYLIANSWDHDPHVLRYSIRRFTRLYPAYIALLVLTVFVLGPLTTSIKIAHYYEWGALNYLWSNLRLNIIYGLPGVFDTLPYTYTANGSLWTLPVEVALYVLAAIVLAVAGKQLSARRKGVMIGAALVSVAAGSAVQLLMERGVLTSLVFYGTDLLQFAVIAPYFFMGMLYTLPQARKCLNLQLAMGLTLITLMFQFPLAISVPLMYLSVPYAVFSFAFAPSPIFYRLGSKTDITYGMYLYGFPVQQLVVWLFLMRGLTLSFWPVFLLSIAGTLILALLSWHLIEKPSAALSQWIIKKSKQRNKKRLS